MSCLIGTMYLLEVDIMTVSNNKLEAPTSMSTNPKGVFVPYPVYYFLETAFGDKQEAILKLLSCFSGDTYYIDEDYREWCDNEEEALVLSDRAIDEIAEWITNSDHQQDALNLINGYYTDEMAGN